MAESLSGRGGSAFSVSLERSLAENFEAHAIWIDGLVGAFESELSGMVAAAQVRVLADLRDRPMLTAKGILVKTPANQRALRKIDSLIM